MRYLLFIFKTMLGLSVGVDLIVGCFRRGLFLIYD